MLCIRICTVIMYSYTFVLCLLASCITQLAIGTVIYRPQLKLFLGFKLFGRNKTTVKAKAASQIIQFYSRYLPVMNFVCLKHLA